MRNFFPTDFCSCGMLLRMGKALCSAVAVGAFVYTFLYAEVSDRIGSVCELYYSAVTFMSFSAWISFSISTRHSITLVMYS